MKLKPNKNLKAKCDNQVMLERCNDVKDFVSYIEITRLLTKDQMYEMLGWSHQNFYRQLYNSDLTEYSLDHIIKTFKLSKIEIDFLLRLGKIKK